MMPTLSSMAALSSLSAPVVVMTTTGAESDDNVDIITTHWNTRELSWCQLVANSDATSGDKVGIMTTLEFQCSILTITIKF